MLLSQQLNDFRVMSKFQSDLGGYDSNEGNLISIVLTDSETEEPFRHCAAPPR